MFTLELLFVIIKRLVTFGEEQHIKTLLDSSVCKYDI